MRFRTLALALAGTAAMAQISDAVVRPKGAEEPLVSADHGPRTYRTTAFARAAQLASAGLPGWRALWDRDTDVPLRLWGAGEHAPGAVADAAIAEAAARRFLATHLAVLAPGARVADFELVSNQLSGTGDVRSVGFVQRAGGVRVLGGAIGLSFKRDRLALVSSTALPHVSAHVTAPAQRLAPGVVAARAAAWLAAEGHAVAALAPAHAFAPALPERVIVPVVRPRRAGAAPDITYRVAEQVTVASTTAAPGRWDVWLDAADGAPIARRTQLHFATGTVLFDVADRWPGSTRSARPASFAAHRIGDDAATAGLDGTITWAGDASAEVGLGVRGPYVAITNRAGSLAAQTMTLAPGGTLTWSMADDEFGDAQLTAFVHAAVVKEFARTHFDPNLPWLDEQLSVTVNEAQTCNAYSTGDDIHFFRASALSAVNGCENTARLADVVYHEFGHSLHFNAIIEGVGQWDGALSEGMSDALAMLITGDHGMGRGFRRTNAPLRDLNPVGRELRWPDDVTGQVHADGEIIGGTLWDLGVALDAKLGPAAGQAKAREIYYGILQRASDIPSSYAEALLADDDDGDLSNGTPNQCEIDAAFGAHGLADPVVRLGLETPVRDRFAVSMVARAAAAGGCGGPTIAEARIEWRTRGAGASEIVTMTVEGETYHGEIPRQPEGTVIQYKVAVKLSDGSVVSFPNNPADPLYEVYVGPTVPLWCTDFEAGIADWTIGGTPTNRIEWEVGPPLGLGGDPRAAFSGTNVLGTDLARDGLYRNRAMQYAETPEIDLRGHTHVRLQFQRWLGVEDSQFDQAVVSVNGFELWRNSAAATEQGVSHIDREWRFVDFDLAARAADGKVTVRFDLSSDTGLSLGGWTIDDLCVVAATGAAVTCGNGTIDDAETCDDGNRIDGDGCSADCLLEDADVDVTGCCSVGGGPEGALALSLLTLGVAFRPRRRGR